MGAPETGEQALQRAFNDADESLNVTVSGGVDLDPGDIQIGAVEIKNGADDTRAKVGAGTGVAEGDNALATHDGAVGHSDDAATEADTNGSVIAKLRGLAKNFGKTTDAATTDGNNGSAMSYWREIRRLLTRRDAALTPTAFAAAVADADLTVAAGRLHGLSMVETTGANPAKAYLRDGAGGTILATVSLAPGESTRDFFGDRGVAVANGVRLDWIVGTIDGVVYTGAV